MKSGGQVRFGSRYADLASIHRMIPSGGRGPRDPRSTLGRDFG